ncbi:hypothetical protein BDQ17DRAFT_1340497 [Cyathus striatus]|nr:hypothetical protein BDQ17DRAFT_1340497 [Cyathus striatus]
MSDPRFARLKTDPRFRRPKKNQSKVVVDERFKGVFQAEKKSKSGRVDKYGRPISSTYEQDNLKHFYRLEDEDEANADEIPRILDLARGQVLLESSDEEDDANENDDSDIGDIITIGTGPSKPISIPRDEELEIDLDENNFADLQAQAEAYARENPEEDVGDSQRTNRIAIVNLDWDHVRATHLYKICASLVSPTSGFAKDPVKKRSSISVNIARGKVLSVRIFPSQFGKERMAKEEKEGPPPEIFKRPKDLGVDEVNEQSIYEVGDENEYDEDALRKYQLERLRYYYAIVTCDTVNAASHIYNELQGTELERSANVFDLSFVPDDMSFDEDPRDEANEELGSYNAVEFVTDALRHSKVKLTWDEDDPERVQITRRTLTRKELEESDFKAYIASSSDESEGESSVKDKKGNNRDKLRALLLGGNDEDMPEGWGDTGDNDDIDMEITFTPGLSEKKNEDDETTLERYQRKMREKRKKRKEEVKETSIKEAGKEKSIDDDFFETGSGDEDEDSRDIQRKNSVKDRTGNTEEQGSRKESTTEELELIAASDNPNADPRHFNLKSVLKAEKSSKKGKKTSKKGKLEEDNEVQEDFAINVKDDRFKVLFEDHQFAIDPSNPHFKKTKSMSALLEERQRRRHSTTDYGDKKVTANPKQDHTGKSLQSLVESVKRKGASASMHSNGKRRKI